MPTALRTAVGAYSVTKRVVTSLILIAFGFAYVGIGGMVLRLCWPQLSMKHAARWTTHDGFIEAMIVAIIIGSAFLAFQRSVPRPLRGLLFSAALGLTLYYAPANFQGMDEFLEPVAAVAGLLVLLGVMNVFEALPAGFGEQRRALKDVATQTTLGVAGDASETQARAALRGKRGGLFGRRSRSADDLEF